MKRGEKEVSLAEATAIGLGAIIEQGISTFWNINSTSRFLFPSNIYIHRSSRRSNF